MVRKGLFNVNYTYFGLNCIFFYGFTPLTADNSGPMIFEFTQVDVPDIMVQLNPLYAGNGLMGTLANSEDSDEMSHDAAFHQGQHCLLRLKQFSEKEI